MTRNDLRAVVLALAVASLAAPAAAVAQAASPGRGPAAPEMLEKMERRMRIARSLGLAEALDLDEAGAARLNAVMAPFDARRKAILEGVQGDVRTLRKAARKGDAQALAAVDGAVQRIFEARASVVALDREMFTAVTRGMTPDKVARAALFFAQFRQRFGMEMQDGAPGGGPGAGPGRGR